jgi:hypothetical protein
VTTAEALVEFGLFMIPAVILYLINYTSSDQEN